MHTWQGHTLGYRTGIAVVGDAMTCLTAVNLTVVILTNALVDTSAILRPTSSAGRGPHEDTDRFAPIPTMKHLCTEADVT